MSEDDRGTPPASKPDEVSDLDRGTWKYIAKRTWREFKRDECMDQAAGLTYYAVMSIFPALLAMLALVGLIGQGEATARALQDLARQLHVPSADDVIAPALDALATSPAGPGLAFVISLATALWSASGYVGSFGRALNRIYEVREGRPFWKLRPLLLVVTIVGIGAGAAIALALAVSGPIARSVGSALGLGDVAINIWNVVKWPLLLLVVVALVALLYYATPNVKQPRFRWISIGATFAIIVWILGTVVFAIYVSTAASYDRVYGRMAGVIIFLLWLWLTNLALLVGAELDSELERGRELEAGMHAETELQLPPRDTHVLREEEEQDRQDAAEGREIRVQSTEGSS